MKNYLIAAITVITFYCPALAQSGGEIPTASATFTKSDDGKTLTITGKGDLTTLNITTYDTKFTSSAVGYVFVKPGDEYISINTGDNFSETESYYKVIIPGEKTIIQNTGTDEFLKNSIYVKSSSTIRYLKSEYVGQIFTSPTPTSNNWEWIGDGTLVGEYDAIDTDSKNYYIIDENGKTNVKIGSTNYKANPILSESYDTYFESQTRFIAAQAIYVTTDDVNFAYIAENTSAVYNKSARYYIAGTPSYKLYSPEEGQTITELFTNNNYIKKTVKETSSFVNTLYNYIIENTTLSDNIYTGSYEIVEFKNESESEEDLYINDEIVRTILFPGDNGKTNGSIKTLDLGETTIESLSAATFQTTVNQYSPCHAEHIIIPKTKEISVLDENDNVDSRMVVPTQLFINYTYQNYLKKITIPEGYEHIADKAFYGNSNFSEINIPSTLKMIGESAFENCGALNSIELNEGLVTIGKRAFAGTTLTNISFPSSLRNILAEAFSNVLTITELKFNQGLEFIGNCAFYTHTAIKNQEVINIPSSVKYIGPGALSGRWFKDVYFYSSTAPVCPVGKLLSNYNTSGYASAFDDKNLMGNNGFNKSSSGNSGPDNANSGYANRMNYINNDCYFAMLHFPVGISEENAKTYTDITRVYTTYRDQYGTFQPTQSLKVGKETNKLSYNTNWSIDNPGIVNPGYEDTYLGSQYIWPSQTQWMRSFVCNSLGLEWDGVTQYCPTFNDNSQINLMIKDELNIKGNSENSVKITAENYTTYKDELSKIAYLGTRQFVLADGDHEDNPTYTIDVEGGKWWTLCVPFNMTKAEIDKVFGEGTYVCLFSGIERVADAKNNSITFKFQHDVYRHRTVKDSNGYSENFSNKEEACNADDIVIYAHEAYMIYPTKTNEDAVFVVNDYEPVSGSPLPTIVTASDKTTIYRFVGNYTTKIGNNDNNNDNVATINDNDNVATIALKDITIPQYSYMYAMKKGDADYKFWFYSGDNMNWKANKCVVQTTAKGGGYNDFTTFFANPTNSAKQTSIFGMEMEDDETTDVKKISIIAGEDKENIIYDICGRRISVPQKGMYIKNGKKYIIK